PGRPPPARRRQGRGHRRLPPAARRPRRRRRRPARCRGSVRAPHARPVDARRATGAAARPDGAVRGGPLLGPRHHRVPPGGGGPCARRGPHRAAGGGRVRLTRRALVVAVLVTVGTAFIWPDGAERVARVALLAVGAAVVADLVLRWQ